MSEDKSTLAQHFFFQTKQKMPEKKKNKSKLLLLAAKKKPNKAKICSYGDEKFKLSRCQSYQGKSDTTEPMDIVDDQARGIQFHEEMILEILSMLPVRSLQRFKCVSSFWKALISDLYFMRKHLNHAKNDPNSQKLLISQRMHGRDDESNFYSSYLSSDQVVDGEQKLDCPSNLKPLRSMIYCSCDGLVIICVSDGIDKQLLLWNPSTRESILLPHPESAINECLYGLGYDAASDDYKILTINLRASNTDEISVEILALKSGSWRKIGKYPTGIRRVLPCWHFPVDSLAFVNGAFHWLGLSRCYTIVSFDISNELYGEIPLRENTFSRVYTAYGVSVLRGMLCFYSTYNNMRKGTFKVWVMKDYGVKESWTQVLTIQDTNFFCSAIPQYIFADGEVLLSCKYFTSVGYIRSTSRGPFGLSPECPECLNCKIGFVYTESLISPKFLI